MATPTAPAPQAPPGATLEAEAASAPLKPKIVPGLLLAAACSALLWASFFPLAWGWLAWFALVPLLALVRRARPVRRHGVLPRRASLFRRVKSFFTGWRQFLHLLTRPRRPWRRARLACLRHWLRRRVLLHIARHRAWVRRRAIFLASWVAGLLFFWPVLQWMSVADYRMYVTWAILATYCSLYFPIGITLLRWLDRRTSLPLTLTLPVVWCALEFFRARFIGGFVSLLTGSHLHDVPGGFGWYFLGYTQHDFLEIVQIADIAGVYGVSFLICAVNGLLFEILFARKWFRAWVIGPDAQERNSRFALLGQGGAVLAGLLLALAYGGWQLHRDTSAAGPRLALLQGNVDQRIRNMSARADAEGKTAQGIMFDHYGALSNLAGHSHPDLIVWPETSFPDDWLERPPGRPIPATQALAFKVAASSGTAVLLGMTAYARLGPNDNAPDIRRYNSAILVDERGRFQGRYDKIHRVPFGEYVPMRSWLPFMNWLAPYDFEYSVWPGESFTRFPLSPQGGPLTALQKYTFGVLICYEDTDPVMARPYAGADGKPPTDFLLNISNDGWFDGSSEHDEHLALCRFRAIENRRAIARAVNMGISAVIDANGRVLRPRELTPPPGTPADFHLWEVTPDSSSLPTGDWHRFKKVGGVLLATLPIDSRGSVYGRFGDWLPGLCWGLLLLAFIVVLVRGRPSGRPEHG